METAEPLGTVAREDDQWVLRYERDLAHPPEKVWRALTESEHLQHWLPCDIVGERRAGAAIALPFWPATIEKYELGEMPVLSGRIEVWEPPQVFVWWWDTDRLRFQLVPTATGTRLSFTTWTPADGAEDAPAPHQTAAGYHVCLDSLAELLATGTSSLADEAPIRALEARYADAIGRSTSG